MFTFVIPTLQKKLNEIRMKELAGGKCMENDCFLRTLKFEMFDFKFSCLVQPLRLLADAFRNEGI
jgi:hypothetical protein